MPKRENAPGIEKAKAVCRRCPVKVLCLQEGLTPMPGTGDLPHGIWGGATYQERLRIQALLGGRTLAEARQIWESQSAAGQTS